MPVGFRTAIIFRETVVRIRNNKPQNIPSSFTDLFQPYAAVLIDTTNHIAVMEGLTSLFDTMPVELFPVCYIPVKLR